MGKAPTIKIPVEWESENQILTATFNKGCNAAFIVKELNNAPVDTENERTRCFAKNGWAVNDTMSKAYFDNKIVLKIPSKGVDTSFIFDNSIWVPVKDPTIEASSDFPAVLEFTTELKSASKEKQTVN